MTGNYYLKNKGKLTRQFRFGTRIQKQVLTAHFGQETADRWMEEAESRFERLLGELPDIGGSGNSMLKFLTITSDLLPVAELMKRDGVAARKIGQVIFEMAEAAYRSIPGIVRRAIGRGYTSPRTIRQWRLRARESAERKFPGDWVVRFIEEDDRQLFGLDMSECALVKFWRAQGLEELVPYLCLSDWAIWKASGANITRTRTLANGAPTCDYRYLRGKPLGESPRGWPPESMEEWTGIFEQTAPAEGGESLAR